RAKGLSGSRVEPVFSHARAWITSVMSRRLTFRITLTLKSRITGAVISTAGTSQAGRSASASAFVHSLNILVKYVRLYGFEHKRTETQFETAWNELQQAAPKTSEQGFLLGVSGNKLLLDGIPLESGQAERSFAQL